MECIQCPLVMETARTQICVSQTLSETNRNEHTKLPASIQAQSVDGAFLASATRCPTSRLDKRLAEKRKAALSAKSHSTTQCTPRFAEEDRLKTLQRRNSDPRCIAWRLYVLLKICQVELIPCRYAVALLWPRTASLANCTSRFTGSQERQAQ